MNPYMLIVLGVLTVSTSGPVIKLINADPDIVAFYRVLFGFFCFFVFNMKIKKSGKKIREEKSSFIEKIVFMSGGIFLAFHFYFWISSFSTTTVAGAVIPLMIQPVLVTFLGYLFFKEKVKGKLIVPLVIVFAAILIMTMGDYSIGGDMSLGDLYSVIGTVMVSVYLLIARNAVKKVGVISYNTFSYFIASIILFVIVLLKNISFGIADATDFMGIMWLGFGCSFLGYMLINISLKHFTVSEVSIALIGEPVLGIFWAFVFLKELPNLYQVIGFLIGLTGLLTYIKIMKKIYSAERHIDKIKQGGNL